MHRSGRRLLQQAPSVTTSSTRLFRVGAIRSQTRLSQSSTPGTTDTLPPAPPLRRAAGRHQRPSRGGTRRLLRPHRSIAALTRRPEAASAPRRGAAIHRVPPARRRQGPAPARPTATAAAPDGPRPAGKGRRLPAAPPPPFPALAPVTRRAGARQPRGRHAVKT